MKKFSFIIAAAAIFIITACVGVLIYDLSHLIAVKQCEKQNLNNLTDYCYEKLTQED